MFGMLLQKVWNWRINQENGISKISFRKIQDHHRYAMLNWSLFDPFILSPSFTFWRVFVYLQTKTLQNVNDGLSLLLIRLDNGVLLKKVLFMIIWLTLSNSLEAVTRNGLLRLTTCCNKTLLIKTFFLLHLSQNNSMKTTIDLVNDDIRTITRVSKKMSTIKTVS